MPEKPDLLELLQEHRHEAERVGAAHPRQDRRVRYDRKHLGGHLHDDAVGVTVGHEAGQRAAARHAVSTGVVDDDEVRATSLGALGGYARPGAAADDRPACGHFGANSPEDFTAGDCHGSAPIRSCPATSPAACWLRCLRTRDR